MRRCGWYGFAAAALGMAMVVGGCGPKAKPPEEKGPVAVVKSDAGEVEALWKVQSARRQSSYARMDLPVVVKGMRVEVGTPEGPGKWSEGGIAVYSSRMYRGSVEGPLVDQLMGEPRTGSDAGSYLVALAGEEKDGVRSFEVDDPMPLYMKVEVGAAQEPGVYRFPVTLTAPGRAASETAIEVTVSEVALPTEPRVLAVMTTTTAELGRLYPETFGVISGANLDRGAADAGAAMAQLDALVTAAHMDGVALFVEDFGPRVKVNNVGEVELDWDAYDRVMQPYMDGTEFADRLAQAVWLAPVPPRRLRDSATQLRQYVAACAEHFAAKGWVATPAFMHPALATEGTESGEAGSGDKAEEEAAKLREEVARVLKLHMTREMLAVTTPDAVLPQARLWVVDDADPRLPPAGALATEASVRLWPWVCAARGTGAAAGTGVKGFVWRGGLARAGESTEGRGLLMVGPKDAIYPGLRLAWLNEGMNDTAMLGLLEKRSDPAVVNEVLGGIVGRTGLTGAGKAADLPTAPAGFLYAGWPADKGTWAALPGMLEKLVLANEPGKRVVVSPDDPLYIATKLWLAKAHRPVARVAGYRFGLRAGSEGAVIDAGVDLLVENPVDAAVEMEARFTQLPGDFDVVPAFGEAKGQRVVKMGAYGLERVLLPVAGHVDVLVQRPGVSQLQLSERSGGSELRLPVQLPVYRMKAAVNTPKVDGHGKDWPMDAQTRSYGVMTLGARYLSRPDLLSGTVRRDEDPATVRWEFDADYLYALVRCPQTVVSDERNTDWPAAGEGRRWWGSDGVQIQLANLEALDGGKSEGRVVVVAFKPGGVAMTRVATVKGSELGKWTEGPAGVKYGMSVEKENGRVKGYVVEAAIPRKWFGKGTAVAGVSGPALRVNVLRHRAQDLTSSSWSGPVVNDEDVAMMGLLLGNE